MSSMFSHEEIDALLDLQRNLQAQVERLTQERDAAVTAHSRSDANAYALQQQVREQAATIATLHSTDRIKTAEINAAVKEVRKQEITIREQAATIERLQHEIDLRVEQGKALNQDKDIFKAQVERLTQENAKNIKYAKFDVASLQQQVREQEHEIRNLMWLNHGHVMIYGDDGEMQCGQCAKFGCWDYKNAPLAEVRNAYNLAFLERVSHAHAALAAAKEPE